MMSDKCQMFNGSQRSRSGASNTIPSGSPIPLEFEATTAPGDSGWFDAPVVDLGSHGHWGAIDWAAEVPRGTRVQLRTRSGNSSSPDDNWSDWSALVESGSKVPSPPARYLQYRLVLHGDGKRGPTVWRVSLTARQTNLPPRIESLTTFAYRGNPQAPGPLPPQPPNGGGNNKQLPQRKSLRLVRWKASDANDDQLRFRIYLRGEGQEVWKLVQRGRQLQLQAERRNGGRQHRHRHPQRRRPE